MAGSARQVQLAGEAAVAALADAFATTSVCGSREEWAGAVGALQRVIDVASAAQDAAIVRLAAVEPELLEDGTVVETHRALGHVALDAPAIVSGVLSVSAVHAEGRVRTAVRLAADGPAGSATDTGLGGLHQAMAAGRLDAYRAGVVAAELEEAPAEVRATVVAALDAHVESEDAAHLRRRCRRALARISPDLLRQRAQRARAESRLRRWVDEPGVDRWEGTFPSEEAAQAWAAIDALAHRYVTEQVCATIERARAKALTDLVAGNATIETVVTLTVPATALPGQAPTTVPRTAPTPATEPEVQGAACPQCAIEPETQPLAHLQPATEPQVQGQPHAAPSGVRDGDLVEVTGLHGSQPALVSRRWLTATLEDQRPGYATAVVTARCHPATGAVLDADSAGDLLAAAAAAAVGADRYRPSTRLVKLVRARDRRCRFPGCTVAAVFCDLDHVRPWPTGHTTAENLMCLCRRHHRVKQRPGWQVVLAADGLATWTDPTGRARTTAPVDALHATVLTDEPDAASAGCAAGPCLTASAAGAGADHSRARTVVPDGPHSHLEFVLEHRGAAGPGPTPRWRDHRGRHRVDVSPRAGAAVQYQPVHHWSPRPIPPGGRRREPEPPPF